MSTTFFAIWAAMLLFDGALMRILERVVRLPRYAAYRVRAPKNYELPARRKKINTTLNGLFALSIYAAFFALLGDVAIAPELPSAARFVGETLGALLLYDFAYYFLHRFMHRPKVMEHVHRVHHLVRYPTAGESGFLHPAETFAGVGLLLASVLVLGPVSWVSFLAIYFLHSAINIIVHCGIRVPHPAFRLTNFWVERHDIHHHRLTHNYASIFPFWDQAFGTFR